MVLSSVANLCKQCTRPAAEQQQQPCLPGKANLNAKDSGRIPGASTPAGFSISISTVLEAVYSFQGVRLKDPYIYILVPVPEFLC